MSSVRSFASVFFLRPLSIGLAVLLGVSLVSTAQAQAPRLAPTPPMGWNSWDSYGLTITEAQFRANVKVEAETLRPTGYRYAVVDEGWYLENPEAAHQTGDENHTVRYDMDAHGRYLPAGNRFPSGAGGAGFAPIAAAVHQQGLKFGIHIIRGIPKQAVAGNLPLAGSAFHAAEAADTADTCSWNPDNFGVRDTAAGQAWYDSLFAQYAAWGVDYVKVDCIASRPYKGDEIRMIHRAILKTGRPIVLSLSPGPAPLAQAAELAANAQLWRISDDVWDFWTRDEKKGGFPQSVTRQFAVIAGWNPYVKPGNWPDADMLPLGRLEPVPGYGKPRETRLTHEEQRTLFTLWSMARSPLFFGGNLTELDDWTRTLITSPELVRIDQTAHASRPVSTTEGAVLWTADLPGGEQAVAIFNLSDQPLNWASSFADLHLPAKSYRAHDVWGNRELGRIDHPPAMPIEPHGCLLLLLKR
jgi:alpha-galactosidase